MRPSQLSIKLLAGAGLVAGVLLLGASPASAAPPAPVIDSAPASPGSDPSPTWTFTSTAPTQCLLSGPGVSIGPAACTGSAAYDLSASPYATYTFTVVAVDAGFSVTTDTYVYVPAPPTITARPGSPDNDTTPTWSFSLPSGTTGQCTLSFGGAAVAGPAACSGSETYTVGAGEGTYTFSVVAVAGGGATSTPATSTFVLDTTPPGAPAVTSGPAATDVVPAWSFTTGAGTASTLCSLASGGITLITPAACTSPHSFDLSDAAAYPDGTYTFTVTALDSAGNQASDSASYTLARPPLPPPPPTIDSGPLSPSNDLAPSWIFTLPSGTTGECSMSFGGSVVAGPVACAGSQTFTASNGDGDYTFSVVAIGPGGSSTPATSTFTLDTRPPPPPPPPSPTLVSSPSSPGNSLTPTWTFTLPVEAGSAECTLSFGSGVVAGPVPCSGSQAFTAGSGDGDYTFSVVAIGRRGRSIPLTSVYSLDTTPPGAPAITARPGPNDLAPTWAFTPGADTAGTTCSLSLGGSVLVGPVDCTNSVTYDFATRPDGDYTLTITAVDALGNPVSVTDTFTFVRLPPADPSVTGGPAALTSNPSPTWSFTLPGGATGECSLVFGGVTVAGPVACSGSQPFAAGSGDGIYTFAVVAVGPTGLRSTPVTSTFTLDTTPPGAPVVTSGPPWFDTTPTWVFTTDADTTTTCSLRSGSSVISGPIACTGQMTYNLTARRDGTYTITITAKDAAGNTTSTTASFDLVHPTAPVAPVITDTPTSPGHDKTPTWSFTLPPGTIGVCSLLSGGVVVGGPVACTGTRTFAMPADGSYVFEMFARDTTTGLVSPVVNSPYIFDGTAPAAPMFLSTPGALGTTSRPVWRFDLPAGATTVECTLRRGVNVVAGPASCSGSFTANLTSLSDGVYILSIVGLDDVGNRSPAVANSYTVDRTPPSAPALLSGPTGATNNSSPLWAFTTPPGSETLTCSLLDSRGNVLEAAAPCLASKGYDLSALPDGLYTFAVFASDIAGNAGAARKVNITLDRRPPALPIITGGPSITSPDITPTWTFNAPGAATTVCTISQGGVVVVGPVACSSPADFDLRAMPNGTYTFSVVAADALGNTTNPATSSYTLRASRPAPGTQNSGGQSGSGSGGGGGTVTPKPAVGGPLVNGGPSTTPTTRPAITRPGTGARPGNRAGSGSGSGGGGNGSGGDGSSVTVPTEEPSAPARIIGTAGRVATEVSKRAAFPLLLLALVFFFLVIQNQIDRRDPKLAQAPVHAGEDLEFGPPPTRRGSS
jgi:hypothetical protein